MYGPDVAIFTHDMRHIGFRKLTVVNETPRDLRRHSIVSEPRYTST